MKKQKPILKRTSAIVLSLAMLFSNLDTMLLTSMAMETDTTECASKTLEEDLPAMDEQSTELLLLENDVSLGSETHIERELSDMEEISSESNLQDKEMPTDVDNSISEEAISDETSITEVDTLSDLSDEVIELNTEDNLNSTNMYATKRLIVLSDTSEFDSYNAISVVNYGNLYILTYETEKACKSAYMQLSENSTILSVEIDAIMETEENDASSTENVTTSTETDLKVYLNSLTPSKEIKVAILDTGIDTSKFDNIIDLGINLSSSGEENSILDDNGHGTEMATIITSNSNDYVKLMPIKIANSDGKATVLNTYLGIKKAIENEADVINISMNTIKSNTSHILEDAINEASDKGIIVVVSAGNNSMDIKDVTPSYIESAIVVSAVDKNNNFASYSNYGETVDYCSYGTYGDKTGTSYAAANVTSVIADALSKNESASILDQYLIDLGDDGFDSYYGKGFVGFSMFDNNAKSDISEFIPENYFESTIFDVEWKNLSDEELNEYISNANEFQLAVFLQNLSKEDLDLILSKETILNEEHTTYKYSTDADGNYIIDTEESTENATIYKLEPNTNNLYVEYLLNISVDELSVSNFTSTTGYFYLQIIGGGKADSSIKITAKTNKTSTEDSTAPTVTYSITGTNKHGFELTGGSIRKCPDDTGAADTWDIFVVKGKYTKSAYTYSTGSTEKVASGARLNFEKYDLNDNGDSTINKAVYHSDKTDEITMQVNSTNMGINGWRNDNVHGILRITQTYPTLTINYNANGATSGTINASKTINYGSSDDLHNFSTFSLTKTGYSRRDGAEWNTSKNGSGTGFDQDVEYAATTYLDFTDGTEFKSKSMTVYAQWNINSYTMTCQDYLTDGVTYLGSPGSTTRNYGASISGSEWGTSSPYNNAQYSYYYNSCTTINPVTGNSTVYRYWTRITNAYLQTVYVRYQNVDGSWGNYGAVINQNYDYGSTVSWSRAEDAEFYAASISYTVTGPNTKYVDVYRKSYNVTCIDYLTDKTTTLGTQTAKAYNYGATAKGSDWGTSSPYNNAQYTYTYNSCTTINPVTGNSTVYRYWTRTLNQYTVTYIDVVDSTSGKQLGKTTKNINYGTTVKGSDLGSDTSDNKYYNGYYYVSDTSATVTTSGITVYRIFKLRNMEISGNIIWEDWNNKNSSRPDNVTLHIYGSDGSTYNYQISGGNSANTTINSWPYSKEVPKYDENGDVITYTVGQDKAESQETGIAYLDPIVNGYDITNIASTNPDDVPVKPEINVTVTTEWIDNDNQYGFRPNEITIRLLQNGVVIDEVTTSEASYTFDKLYKYDENGNLYEYTINSNEVDRYTLSLDNERPYKKVITYTFQAPTYSVIIPKTVIIDGKTGIGEYAVSVQGIIDDRDSVNVVPNKSFTMENKYLSPTTATVKQTITSFTNENNIKDGTTATGTITTHSLAGEWSGNFNFKIYFEFGN